MGRGTGRVLAAASGCLSLACGSLFALANWDDSRLALALERRAVVSAEPTMGSYDFVVVGGGIIGLAVARQLMMDFPKRTVCVLEREAAVGQHQTSHNSGVIHAGLYDPPDTLKGRLCPRGASLMREYCEANGLPYRCVGKYIVAADDTELPVLEDLRAMGTANGVKGLEIIDAAALRQREPNVAGVGALWSPNTGIADFAAVTRCLATEVSGVAPAKGKGSGSKRSGGTVVCNFAVSGFEGFKDRVRVHGGEPGQCGPAKSVDGRIVVTAAGLHMDTVATAAGGAPLPRVVAFRGRYWQLRRDKRDLVKANVYPVPGAGGIPVGIHFTPTVDEQRGEQLIVGPGTALCLSRNGYSAAAVDLAELGRIAGSTAFWKFAASNLTLAVRQVWQDVSKDVFLRDAQRLVPGLTADDLEVSFSGVMAQVFDPRGHRMPDYAFEITAAPASPAFALDAAAHSEAKGLVNTTTMQQASMCPKRVLNCRSLPSPAGTSALAIAEHVSQLVQTELAKELTP